MPIQRNGLGLAAAALVAMCAGVSIPTRAALASASGVAVGPHQHFIGLVNGSTGSTKAVIIQMGCFGPIRPGQTGHPLSGQTVALKRVSSTYTGAGVTGDQTTSIGAFFGAVPPGTSPSSTSYIDFTAYGQKPLPTSLTLPCSGKSQVSFVPLPVVEPSRDFTVAVTYVGQP